MPGVVVTTAVRRGARNTVNNATSSLFIVGDAERGASRPGVARLV